MLRVVGRAIETPALFPVLNLLTGPPPLGRNGATHQFLKHQLIFEDQRAGLMSEALHFTDYPITPRTFRQWFPHTIGGKVQALDYWVQQGLRALGKEEDTAYKPLFFLDSGGFRLLAHRDVDITGFGYASTKEDVLQLQLDYGADIVASLDYPLAPGLQEEHARLSIEKSVENAISLMHMLYDEKRCDLTGKRPFPVLAVHGQTGDQLQACIVQLLERLAAEGFREEPFGIGIGSLVPLRKANNAAGIVTLVKAALDTLYRSDTSARFRPQRILVHAFGVTGTMIPLLAHLGVDTFDSSSYVKSAAALSYGDPVSWQMLSFQHLKALSCACNACRGITPRELSQLQEDLRGESIQGTRERLNHHAGHFIVKTKSDIYGLIAYHNLNLHDDEIRCIRSAIEADEPARHLARFGSAHPQMRDLIELITK